MRNAIIALFAIITPATAGAQPERYELGRKLKLFEIEWDKQTEAVGRKRALEVMPKVMQQFFTFQFGEAGRTLDTARFALLDKDPPSNAERWIAPIHLTPGSRLIDMDAKELPITLAQFYKPDATKPEKVAFQVSWPNEKLQDVAVAKFPTKTSIALPKALAKPDAAEDVALEYTVELDGKPATSQSVIISRVANLKERLAQLKKAAAAPSEPPTIESATLTERVDLLEKLADGQTLETDYPAAKLLLEAEAISAAGVGKAYFTADKPGQFWMSVPTGKGKQTALRVLVPKGLDAKKPVPVVVALHGAGGSENLFFEGYGNGQIVKECEKRGWILIAPRSALAFAGGGPPVGDILDALAKRYPIDPALAFIVGHSMGAVQTIDAVQAYPKRFAAAAALGGGGRVRKPDLFKTLPVFVGVGGKDFALGGSKALYKALVDGGATAATFREYESIEHMVIVRAALPDVFALFDKLAQPAK